MLYIIATPIGNLKDITLRALEVLRGVDLIVCENIKVTKKLLSHYDISKPLISYFQHSRLSKVNYIIGQLRQGKNIALVTDAGTPGISDPGGKLVHRLVNFQVNELENLPTYQLPNPQIKIIPIPGPCALTAALSISGFRAERFIFMGFPPTKKGRRKFFEEIMKAKSTVVFYESPHRILRSLRDLGKIKTEENAKQVRNIVVCRELTKKFETIYRGTIEEVIKKLESSKENLKGEFVVIRG